jgi:NADPH:quinone reductase-like Zn-dependent oxidoreductase
VKRLKKGDVIYAYLLWGGGWAEYCLTNESEATIKPASITGVEAAAVPLAALTAWQALVDTAHLMKGQTILIQGGSGGVGSFAIQIAKAQGATVIATASTAHQETLRQLGADKCVDYTKDRFEEKAHDVDVVLDTVGGETLDRSYKTVKKGGVVVTIRGPLDHAAAQQYGIRVSGVASHPDSQELSEVTKLIDAGKIRPLVSQVRPLTDAVDATRRGNASHPWKSRAKNPRQLGVRPT